MKAGTSGYQAKQTIINKRYENWLRIGKGSYYKQTATMFLTVWRNCSWKLAKLGVFIKHKTPIITALGYTSSLLIKKLVSTDSHSESDRWCLNEEKE